MLFGQRQLGLRDDDDSPRHEGAGFEMANGVEQPRAASVHYAKAAQLATDQELLDWYPYRAPTNGLFGQEKTWGLSSPLGLLLSSDSGAGVAPTDGPHRVMPRAEIEQLTLPK